MNRCRFFFLLLLLPVASLSAASLEQALEETRRDIQESTAELNALRSDIQAERLPRVREIQRLSEEVSALREEVQRIRNVKALRDGKQDQLIRDVERLKSEKDFVDSVFEEYRRSYGVNLQTGEAQFHSEPLPENPADLWALTTRWWTLRRGGYHFPGTALDAAGREQQGTFVFLGPTGYFANEEISGLLITRPGSAYPGIYPLPDFSLRDAVKALFAGEPAVLPVDISGGDAMKVLQAKPGWIEHIRQGGVVVYPLLLLGLVALLLSVQKAWDLHQTHVSLRAEDLERLRRIRTAGDHEPRSEEFAEIPMPLGSLMLAAFQHRHASRENLEEILHEHVLAEVPRLERSLGLLAVLGGVAPLLGLLGTVTGMIHTFQLVTLFGSGNAKTLSGGISEALVTTELGLMIAIPILLIHALLARKAKTQLGDLEHSAVSIVNLLHAEISDPA